jgi:hypothetical protein
MTGMITNMARSGFVVLIGTILTLGTCGDAVAKTGKRHWHARHAVSDSHAQLVWQQPARLGQMRYYGGPKSPMWRGPVEN